MKTLVAKVVVVIALLAACGSSSTSAGTSTAGCVEGSGLFSAVALGSSGRGWAAGEQCSAGEAHTLLREWTGDSWGKDVTGGFGSIVDLTGTRGRIYALTHEADGSSSIDAISKSGSLSSIARVPFFVNHLAVGQDGILYVSGLNGLGGSEGVPADNPTPVVLSGTDRFRDTAFPPIGTSNGGDRTVDPDLGLLPDGSLVAVGPYYVDEYPHGYVQTYIDGTWRQIDTSTAIIPRSETVSDGTVWMVGDTSDGANAVARLRADHVDLVATEPSGALLKGIAAGGSSIWVVGANSADSSSPMTFAAEMGGANSWSVKSAGPGTFEAVATLPNGDALAVGWTGPMDGTAQPLAQLFRASG
jgi:hypothetical protein